MRHGSDQVDAYRYMRQRVVAAVVSHDPDPARSSIGRNSSLITVGLIITCVLLVGAAIYGLLTGGGGSINLRDPAAIFVEKETGAQYVYTKADDRLHPVANYTSGLLLAASPGAETRTIKRSTRIKRQSATRLELGAPLGIPDAPRTLPRPGDLVREPWQVCSSAAASGEEPRAALVVGMTPDVAGRPLPGPAAGPTDGVLVAGPNGAEYLLHANHKLQLRKPAAVRAAFGWSDQQAPEVAAALLNTLPSGPDLRPIPLDDLGSPSRSDRGRVGQLLRTTGDAGSPQWAVVTRTSVLLISDVQARLLDADPDTHIAAPIELDTAAFGALAARPAPDEAAAGVVPRTVPRMVQAGRGLCATVADAAAGVTAVRVDPDLARLGQTDPAPGSKVSKVVIAPGRGALIEASSSPSSPAGSGTMLVVTDDGRGYPLAGRDALSQLGYGSTAVRRMPGSVASLIPEGPALDVAAARTPQ